MLRMKDQKKDKNAKLNDKMQKAKEIGTTVASVGVVAVVGTLKYGKKAIKYAPKIAGAVINVGKNLIH